MMRERKQMQSRSKCLNKRSAQNGYQITNMLESWITFEKFYMKSLVFK